jgi:general secretion pathway protein H
LPRDRSSVRSATRGFTLIEVIVALAIMALVISLAVPLLRRDDRTASAAAVAEVEAALRAARVTAIAESRTVSFRGTAGSGYRIDGRYESLGAPGSANIRVDVTGKPEIFFYPTGGSSGGRIIVRAETMRRAIAVEALTGRAILQP